MKTDFTLSEDNTTEFKLSFQKEVIETVVAFSNTKGGHIYMGIADIFKTANIIEKYGSGVKRVIKLFKEYGSREPLFEERLGGMVVVAYRKEHFQETTQETTQEVKKLSTREKIILELKNDSFLTRDDLSSKIGVSSNAIKQHLAKLKSDGILKRVGSTKSGYWEVLSNDK